MRFYLEGSFYDDHTMKFSESFIATLRQRLPLGTYIGKHVRLLRKGRLMMGLCPFHGEKTPSFSVNESRGTYHCFGCGARGDIIDFARQYNRASFVDAVMILAGQAGLELPKETSESAKESHVLKDLQRACEAACQWFQDQLQNNETARAYISKRGITADEVRRFRLGWAPSGGWMKQGQHMGFSQECMESAGLIVARSGTGDYFDRFRNRLMFPIMTLQGKVIAFGGRSLGDEQPKYMNSPETSLFIKGQCLYRSLTVPPGRPVLVVEGYLDVISTSRYYGSVAPLGTAMTAQQLALVWKQCPEPVVCFDPDVAGKKAALKMAVSALPLLKPGYSLKFATMPPGYDPHALIQNYGQESLEKIIAQATPLSQFLWNALFGSILTPERKAENIEQWKTWEESIEHLQIRRLYKDFFYQKNQKNTNSSIPVAPGVVLHQKILLGMLVLNPHLIDSVRESLCAMVFQGESCWLHVRQYLISWEEGQSFSELHQFLGDDWQDQIAGVSRHIPSDTPCLESYWNDLFNRYQIQWYQDSELTALKKDLMNVPGTWERLKNLTSS
jgi:DNA primase